MLLGILISVLGTLLCSNYFTIWTFLVLGSLSSCGWLKTKLQSDAVVLYFVVSVIGSILFLLGCNNIILSSLLQQLALLLKLGLAPFQFWVYKVLRCLAIPDLCFFLGPLKFGLLWLIVNIQYPSLILASASLFVGVILLWLTERVHLVLYASGSCQLIILVFLGSSLFPVYYFIYLLSLLGIAWFNSHIISSFVAFLGLGALPPFTIFWAKILALFALPTFFAIVVLLVSLLTLWPYIRCSIALTSPAHSSLVCCLFLIICPSYLVSLFI